jgi:hypothetical protein
MYIRKNVRYGRWLGKRFWEYRAFYSAYIALFISISNWITIQYKLVLEHAPVLGSIFSNLWTFLIVAVIIFSAVSILGGHYIHRKRQFRIEQELATEENPYLYKAAPGKDLDLYTPLAILQLEALEDLLRLNNAMTDEKERLFQKYKSDLKILAEGKPIGKFK